MIMQHIDKHGTTRDFTVQTLLNRKNEKIVKVTPLFGYIALNSHAKIKEINNSENIEQCSHELAEDISVSMGLAICEIEG